MPEEFKIVEDGVIFGMVKYYGYICKPWIIFYGISEKHLLPQIRKEIERRAKERGYKVLWREQWLLLLKELNLEEPKINHWNWQSLLEIVCQELKQSLES